MNKSDEKYIQLPPLERDLYPKILSVLWEFCLMDKKNQTMVKEEMQRIVNSKKDEEIDKATIETIESMSEKIPKEEIAGLECLRKL